MEVVKNYENGQRRQRIEVILFLRKTFFHNEIESLDIVQMSPIPDYSRRLPNENV